MPILGIQRDTSFGTPRIYLSTIHSDPALVRAVQRLTGKKTISEDDIADLQVLGVECKEVRANV